MVRVITLREAGRRLEKNHDYAKGMAVGLGVPLQKVGRAWAMTEDDFGRLLQAEARNQEQEAAAAV